MIKDTNILIVDCQATGANPENGHLIEIGWMHYPHPPNREKSLHDNNLETYLIQIPDGLQVPRQVQRVTGVSINDLESGISLDQAWNKLSQAATMVQQLNAASCCPVIIHFAKYEIPFLRYLQQLFAPSDVFPFDGICTHEIVKRLIPDLPRKGLRAAAGYFGFSTPEKRRCEHHLRATYAIWKRVVELLDQNHGIQTLKSLKEWLDSTKPIRNSCRVYPMERALRLNLPDTAGIYRFRRVNGDLLYIGKAKNLKSRVNSYFQNGRKQSEHILEMLSQACDLDYTETGSAVEAALLESDEIKTASPPYNIALKVRERKLGFVSKDLWKQGTTPDLSLSIGPFPSQDLLSSLTTLNKLLCGKDLMPQDGPALLAIPEAYMPEHSMLKEGLKTFIEQYQPELGSQPLLKCVIRLGALFWKRRMDEASAEDIAPEEDIDTVVDEKAWKWTEEAVVKVIEGTIKRCAHLIRRARWLCLISESTLVWSRKDSEAPNEIMSVFSYGRLLRNGESASGLSVPVPPGYQRSMLSRQMNFDLMTYDRMRVLTTEIRRLLTEGRTVKLRLRPNAILGNHALNQFLKWI